MASCALPNHRNISADEKTESHESMLKEYEIEGKKWLLPRGWDEHGEGFRNVQLGPGDVWVMTQPRSGTTVTQELVWLLVNNLDFETAQKFHLVDRSPEITASLFPSMWEQCQIIRPSVEDPTVLETVPIDPRKHFYEVYADFPSPKVIKTHLGLSVHKNILDTGCKVVYLFRNPKDMLVSRARFACFEESSYRGDLETLVRDQIHGNLIDAIPYTPYWQHVKEAWAQRHHPNLLFIHYEDLRADLPATIKKVAAFLGKEYSDEQLAKLADHLDIDNFRKNRMVNELRGFGKHIYGFIGKGRVGGYKEIVSPEVEKEIDEWIDENTKDVPEMVLRYRKK